MNIHVPWFTVLSDFVHRMYAMQDVASLMEVICKGLPELVPGDNVAIARCHADSRSLTGLCAARPFAYANFLPDIVATGLLSSHPFWDYAANPAWPVKTVSDFISARDWKSHPYYCEFIRGDRIVDHMEVEIEGTHRAYTTIDVLRSTRGFSDRERATFNLLRPHFDQAFRNARVAEAFSLTSVLGEEGAASLLRVQTDGVLEDTAWLGSNGRSVPRAFRDWLVEQVGWLNRGAADHVLTPWIWKDNGATMEFRLHRQWGTEGYLMSIRRRTGELASGGRLTPREREVMRWVSAGKSNSEIATILSVSAHTVKDHLKQIYMKFGVENRTAAARVWSERCGIKDECAEG